MAQKELPMLTFALVLGALLVVVSSVEVLIDRSHNGYGGEPELHTDGMLVYARFMVAIGLLWVIAFIALTVYSIVEAVQRRFSEE
jgi:hypothetical protein